MPRHPRSGAAPFSSRYRSDIDGLRGLAIFLVLLFHAFRTGAPNGYLGVDVFFVISGYVITRSIGFQLQRGSFSIPAFYARRSRRLVPALSLVLLTTWALGRSRLVPEEFLALGSHMLAGAGFMANMQLWREAGYFGMATELNPLAHLWSLAVEEQFYLLWPIILSAAFRWRRLSLSSVTLGAILLSLAFRRVFRVDETVLFYLLPARAWEIALGGWVYSLESRNKDFSAGMARTLSIVGAGLVGAAVFLPGRGPAEWRFAASAAGAALLIAAGERASVNRLLASDPAVYAGRISYPLYLWHWPILTLARLPAPWTTAGVPTGCLLLSILLAAATYEWVEIPLRRKLRVEDGPQASRIALAGGLAVLLALAGVGGMTARGRWLTERQRAAEAAIPRPPDPPVNEDRRCFLDRGLDSRDLGLACFRADAASGPRVLLWGDSIGTRLAEPLEAWLRSAGGTLSLAAAAWCPPIPGFAIPDNPNCLEINDYILSQMRRYRPTTVVLSADWMLDFLPYGGDPRRILAAARDLKAAGARRIVIVGQPPAWRRPLYAILQREFVKNGQPPPARIHDGWGFSEARRADAELRSGISGDPDVVYVPLIDEFCAGDSCEVLAAHGTEGPELLSTDQRHPSRTAAARYADRIVRHLR